MRRRHAQNAQITCAVLVSLSSLLALPSIAGRPLVVDDANVNEVGAGHVETWFARQAGSTNVLTVAPAYGLADGIEIGLAIARGASSESSTALVQAKFLFTPALKNACNTGVTLGATQLNNGGGNMPFVNGLLSCNADFGSVHVNVGGTHPPNGPALGMWGIAMERPVGTFTMHLETFGQEQAAPTVQLGVRKDVARNIQWDASAGRVNGEVVLSLGTKFQF